MKTGQLEFVNGGWSSHDEACPSYDMMLINLMAGNKFLREEFGDIQVKIAW